MVSIVYRKIGGQYYKICRARGLSNLFHSVCESSYRVKSTKQYIDVAVTIFNYEDRVVLVILSAQLHVGKYWWSSVLISSPWWIWTDSSLLINFFRPTWSAWYHLLNPVSPKYPLVSDFLWNLCTFLHNKIPTWITRPVWSASTPIRKKKVIRLKFYWYIHDGYFMCIQKAILNGSTYPTLIVYDLNIQLVLEKKILR